MVFVLMIFSDVPELLDWNMEKIRSFRDLVVWQHAMDLAQEVHRLSKVFPKEELYGLTSQTRRSAVSIPSNIAEGHARNTKGEYLQFLGVASGSLAELVTQLILAQRFNYLTEDHLSVLLAQCDKVGKMLSSLKKSLH